MHACIHGANLVILTVAPTPPTKLRIKDIGVSTFSMTWDEAVTDCGYTFSYAIISDCGICSVTSSTSGMCSQWTIEQVCSVRVKVIFDLCGYQMESVSNAVNFDITGIAIDIMQ